MFHHYMVANKAIKIILYGGIFWENSRRHSALSPEESRRNINQQAKVKDFNEISSVACWTEIEKV